ncbi:MAG: nitrate- and nitrite sensing domain-containing protein [Candidatus Margulisiibacteriota bacterium]
MNIKQLMKKGLLVFMAVSTLMSFSFCASNTSKVKLISAIDGLVHGLQLERGVSAKTIGDKVKPQLLTEQRDFVDTAYDKVKASAEESGIELSEKSAKIMDEMIANRDKVDDFSILAKDSNAKFSEANAEWIRIIREDVAKTISDATLAGSVAAHVSLVTAKENFGRGRAFVLGMLGLNKPIDEATMTAWNKILDAQKTSIADFNANPNASKEAMRIVKETLDGPDMTEVKKMRVAIIAKAATGDFGVNSQTWFLKITNVINGLKKADDESIKFLISAAK